MKINSLLSDKNHWEKIRNFCSRDDFENELLVLGVDELEVVEINENICFLRLEMNSGENHLLYIFNYNDVLLFNVKSALIFDAFEEIPGNISALLLKRNADSDFSLGAWGIIKYDDGFCFVFAYHSDMASMNQVCFSKIIHNLTLEIIYFEKNIENLF